jgi:hypothetical protein
MKDDSHYTYQHKGTYTTMNRTKEVAKQPDSSRTLGQIIIINHLKVASKIHIQSSNN